MKKRNLQILYLILLCQIPWIGSCSKPPGPKELDAGIVAVDATCTFLEGVTENQTVLNVCATVSEIAFIAETIVRLLPSRRAARENCTPLRGTDVCATREELGVGIQAVIRRRQAAFRLDGGSP